MKVKEMIVWLESLDPELVVCIEGFTQSSNFNIQTNRFEFYYDSAGFSPKLTEQIDGTLKIGLDV
jgi:hypothetical protein